MPDLLISPHQRRQCYDVKVDDTLGAVALVFTGTPDKSADAIAEIVRSQLMEAGLDASIENAGTTSLGSPLVSVIVKSGRPLEIAKLLGFDQRTTQAIDDYERTRVLGNMTVIASARRTPQQR